MRGPLPSSKINTDDNPKHNGETVKGQVWKDVMAEEYELNMKNDVWDVVLRPKGKYFVTSKWLFKIKH